jgi:hypothetical protein
MLPIATELGIYCTYNNLVGEYRQRDSDDSRSGKYISTPSSTTYTLENSLIMTSKRRDCVNE